MVAPCISSPRSYSDKCHVYAELFCIFLYLRLPECFRNVVLDENVQDIQRAQQLWSEAVPVSQAPAEDLAILLSELAIEVRECLGPYREKVVC